VKYDAGREEGVIFKGPCERFVKRKKAVGIQHRTRGEGETVWNVRCAKEKQEASSKKKRSLVSGEKKHRKKESTIKWGLVDDKRRDAEKSWEAKGGGSFLRGGKIGTRTL